eukprot:3335118-Alexandrium_andersonii.AAC.1
MEGTQSEHGRKGKQGRAAAETAGGVGGRAPAVGRLREADIVFSQPRVRHGWLGEAGGGAAGDSGKRLSLIHI